MSMCLLVASVLLLLSVIVGNSQAMYVPRQINLLCAPDDCTPMGVKDAIKNCWPNYGRDAWNNCLSRIGGSCHMRDVAKVNDCLMNEVYNMTEIKVKEHRELRYAMFYSKALVDCAGDKITIKMVTCSSTAPAGGMRNDHNSMPNQNQNQNGPQYN